MEPNVPVEIDEILLKLRRILLFNLGISCLLIQGICLPWFKDLNLIVLYINMQHVLCKAI